MPHIPRGGPGSSTTSTTSSFHPGDTLQWHVDLTPAYPRGILCAQVQARLFPAIPDEHQGTSRIHPKTSRHHPSSSSGSSTYPHPNHDPNENDADQRKSTSFWSWLKESPPPSSTPLTEVPILLNKRIHHPSSCPPPPPPATLSSSTNTEYQHDHLEVGNQYVVSWTLNPPLLSRLQSTSDNPVHHHHSTYPLHSPSSMYQLSFECIPFENNDNQPVLDNNNDSPVNNEQSIHSETTPSAIVLAKSQPFSLLLDSDQDMDIPLTTPFTQSQLADGDGIEDISSLALLETPHPCPLHSIPDQDTSAFIVPVRVGQCIYDRDALASFFEATQHDESQPPSCPLRNPLDRVCIDKQHFYKVQKYATKHMDALLQERACARVRALASINLSTASVHQDPTLEASMDGEEVRLAQVVLKQVAGSSLDAFTARLRSFKGFKGVFLGRRELERSFSASSALVMAALIQIGTMARADQLGKVVAEGMRSVPAIPLGGGASVASSAASGVTTTGAVIAGLSAFFLFHCAEWAAQSPLKSASATVLADEALNLHAVMGEFIQRIRALSPPPPLPGRRVSTEDEIAGSSTVSLEPFGSIHSQASSSSSSDIYPPTERVERIDKDTKLFTTRIPNPTWTQVQSTPDAAPPDPRFSGGFTNDLYGEMSSPADDDDEEDGDLVVVKRGNPDEDGQVVRDDFVLVDRRRSSDDG